MFMSPIAIVVSHKHLVYLRTIYSNFSVGHQSALICRLRLMAVASWSPPFRETTRLLLSTTTTASLSFYSPPTAILIWCLLCLHNCSQRLEPFLRHTTSTLAISRLWRAKQILVAQVTGDNHLRVLNLLHTTCKTIQKCYNLRIPVSYMCLLSFNVVSD